MDEPLTTTSTAPATGSAGNGHAKLFVSYSRKDRSFVERLSEALKASGLTSGSTYRILLHRQKTG